MPLMSDGMRKPPVRKQEGNARRGLFSQWRRRVERGESERKPRDAFLSSDDLHPAVVSFANQSVTLTPVASICRRNGLSRLSATPLRSPRRIPLLLASFHVCRSRWPSA